MENLVSEGEDISEPSVSINTKVKNNSENFVKLYSCFINFYNIPYRISFVLHRTCVNVHKSSLKIYGC